MKCPFFSIAIPTKNRPDRLANAIRSVLSQTFADIEVIVCDNSDEADATRSLDHVRTLGDPRVRYVRTNGRLSMPDNWEHAVSQARGEFVGVLTDRSVLRRDALEVVRAEIDSTGAKLVSWFNDLYGRDELGTTFKRRSCTFRRHRFESTDVLRYFVDGHPKFAGKIVPKLMTSVCHRSVLDEIRASPVGRCCPPVAPDYCSGFLMLAHTEWVLTLDEALYVSCGMGTGSAFRRRTELGERFRRELGMSWEDMVDRMPSTAAFSHALVLNDCMRIRDALPERLSDVRLNRAQYYVGCLNDYAKVAVRGITTRNEDVDVLLSALEGESDAVRRDVEATRIYQRARQLRADGRVDLKSKLAAKTRTLAGAPPPTFPDVFAALAWDEANPRAPAGESFLDALPTLEAETRKARKGARGDASSTTGSGAGALRRTLGLRMRLRALTRRR